MAAVRTLTTTRFGQVARCQVNSDLAPGAAS